MSVKIEQPYPVFYDKIGKPIDGGLIYIGVEGLNPETNPVQVYFDESFTLLAPQPLRTINGYVSRNGSPANIFVKNMSCSITVKDKFRITQYTDLNYQLSEFGRNDGIESISDLLLINNPKNGNVEYVKSYNAGSNKGGGYFVFDSSKIDVNDGGLIFNGWVRQNVGIPDVFMFGAYGDGVTNDSPPLQKAFNTTDKIYIPEGTYLCNAILNNSFNICGSGKETILKPFNINSPVLTNINTATQSWSNDCLSNLEIRSENQTGIGFRYGVIPAENQYYGVGRVEMNNVRFIGLEKGIHKVNGNIGNKYYSCDFEYCKYGVYATSNQVSIPDSTYIMHSGCDSYYSCNFSECRVAGAAYYDKTHGTGQWTFENCLFQFNYGFGLFFDFDIPDKLFAPIILINTWLEENGGHEVVIDRYTGNTETLMAVPKKVFGTNDIIIIGGEHYDTRVGIGTLEPQRTLHLHEKVTPMIQLTDDITGGVDPYRGGLLYFSYPDLYLENKEGGRMFLHTVFGKLEIDYEGNFVSRKAKIGYGAGAGDVVTQVGFKDRSVVCNKPSGRIITANESISSNGYATFILENTYISENDVVILNVKLSPNGNDKYYTVLASYIRGGACNITIKNNFSSSLAEAIEINFAVISASNDPNPPVG